VAVYTKRGWNIGHELQNRLWEKTAEEDTQQTNHHHQRTSVAETESGDVVDNGQIDEANERVLLLKFKGLEFCVGGLDSSNFGAKSPSTVLCAPQCILE